MDPIPWRNRYRIKNLTEWIDPYRNIPAWMAIPNAGDHFYTWGIVFFQSRPDIRRPIWRSPYLEFAFMFLYLARSMLAMTQKSRHARVLLGDFPYFINAGTHINVAACLYMSIGSNILLMNYVRYRASKQPEFIACYEFLAGRRPPISVLLYEPDSVARLLVKSRIIITLTVFNTTMVGVVSFFLSFLPMISGCTIEEILKYALPMSLIFSIASYYTFCIYFCNMCYFYILCHLLKYRIREINQRIERCATEGRIWPARLAWIRRHYEMVGNDIFRYNGTYWCQYLFVMVITMGTFFNVVLYTALFIDLNLVIRGSLLYATVLSFMAIYFALNTASVVRHESQKTVKILNRLYVSVMNRVTNRTQCRTLLRLMHFLESVTKKRIGFYLLNLFIINYFRFYEIVGLFFCFFLKLIEISRTINSKP